MGLTHRQEVFILSLLDLYHAMKNPIHYSVLAKRIGVSPFTAYDMLRVLEEKGFVTSTYRIESGKTTAGRSEVVFRPTQLAYHRFSELARGADSSDWTDVKSQIMARIHASDILDHELADEILARIPSDYPETVHYCVEVITLLILRLGKSTGRRILVERLPQVRKWREAFSKSSLIILGGFILGLLATDNSLALERDPSILNLVQQYQKLVTEMEPKLVRCLAERIDDMFSIVL